LQAILVGRRARRRNRLQAGSYSGCDQGSRPVLWAVRFVGVLETPRWASRKPENPRSNGCPEIRLVACESHGTVGGKPCRRILSGVVPAAAIACRQAPTAAAIRVRGPFCGRCDSWVSSKHPKHRNTLETPSCTPNQSPAGRLLQRLRYRCAACSTAGVLMGVPKHALQTRHVPKHAKHVQHVSRSNGCPEIRRRNTPKYASSPARATAL